MMVNLRNFKPGPAVSNFDTELEKKYRLIFLFDEDGREWYESQHLFDADSIKVAYDHEGIVRSISEDVSALWPFNLSVAELPVDDITRQVDISGSWKYADGKCIQIDPEDDVGYRVAKKSYLIEEATKNITPGLLKLALKIEISEEETGQLKNRQRYLDDLIKLDVSSEKRPVWPEWPAT